MIDNRFQYRFPVRFLEFDITRPDADGPYTITSRETGQVHEYPKGVFTRLDWAVSEACYLHLLARTYKDGRDGIDHDRVGVVTA